MRIKRVYDPPSKDDGCRILVDRLWPRGIGKSDAQIKVWIKDVAPSDELRRWFGHRPERWQEFKTRYWLELSGKEKALQEIWERESVNGTVTLLYGAKDTRYNNAAALKEYLER